jgi:hypothetical protein
MRIEACERCPGQIAAPVAPTSINKDEIIASGKGVFMYLYE